MSINYSAAGIEEPIDYMSDYWRCGLLSPKFKDSVKADINFFLNDRYIETFEDYEQTFLESELNDDNCLNWKLNLKNYSPVKIQYNNNKIVNARLTEVGIIYFFDDIFPSITAYVELESEENFFTFSKSFFKYKEYEVLNDNKIETYCNGKSIVCDINNINIKLDYSENNIHKIISKFLSMFLSIRGDDIAPEKFLISEPKEKEEE